MGRPLGTKNNMRSPEEKERLILKHLNEHMPLKAVAEEYQIERRLFTKWVATYRRDGIEGLKSRTGKNSSGAGRPKKSKNEEERLQREITKLEIEIMRLKKSYTVKGVGAKKEYVTTFDVNTK